MVLDIGKGPSTVYYLSVEVVIGRYDTLMPKSLHKVEE